MFRLKKNIIITKGLKGILILIIFSCKSINNPPKYELAHNCVETNDSTSLCATFDKTKMKIDFIFNNKSSDSLYVPIRKIQSYGHGHFNDTITEVHISAYDGNSASVFPLRLIIVPPNSIYKSHILIDKKYLKNNKLKYSIDNYSLKIEYLRPKKKYLIYSLEGNIVIDNESLFHESDRIILRNYIEQFDTINLPKEKRERMMQLMLNGKL